MPSTPTRPGIRWDARDNRARWSVTKRELARAVLRWLPADPIGHGVLLGQLPAGQNRHCHVAVRFAERLDRAVDRPSVDDLRCGGRRTGTYADVAAACAPLHRSSSSPAGASGQDWLARSQIWLVVAMHNEAHRVSKYPTLRSP